eukprot:TRINITY_DN20668_c0_g1_i1.p1 TRINITY_DN20668_c0_g1~~TRINITY_DN20668_c0_g1_i1.p1  ORF type:complete len:368 (+),score=66.90 TRINITY_DN20668_c0_g1_i1:93-1196(+)
MVVVEEISSHDHGSRAVTAGDLASTLQDLQACCRDVALLQKKHETLARRIDDSEATREGQLQNMSERIFAVERVIRLSDEERNDAIERVNIAFQKQFLDAQQDRQNLAASIVQINDNFERVCTDMSEMQQALSEMQRRMDKFSQKLQNGFTEVDRCLADCGEQLAEFRAVCATLVSPDGSLASTAAEVRSRERVSTTSSRRQGPPIDLQAEDMELLHAAMQPPAVGRTASGEHRKNGRPSLEERHMLDVGGEHADLRGAVAGGGNVWSESWSTPTRHSLPRDGREDFIDAAAAAAAPWNNGSRRNPPNLSWDAGHDAATPERLPRRSSAGVPEDAYRLPEDAYRQAAPRPPPSSAGAPPEAVRGVYR